MIKSDRAECGFVIRLMSWNTHSVKMSSFSHIGKSRDDMSRVRDPAGLPDEALGIQSSHTSIDSNDKKAAKRRALADRTYYEALKFLDGKYAALVR